jgi:hypothetical protein
MTLQNGLFTLALSALMLAPVAAKAEDVRLGGPHEATPMGPPRVEQRYGDSRPAPPPPVPERARWQRSDGRYELQDRGHYERFWVERTCFDSPYGYQARCVPGHMEQRWVPGYSRGHGERAWGPVYPGRY